MNYSIEQLKCMMDVCGGFQDENEAAVVEEKFLPEVKAFAEELGALFKKYAHLDAGIFYTDGSNYAGFTVPDTIEFAPACGLSIDFKFDYRGCFRELSHDGVDPVVQRAGEQFDLEAFNRMPDPLECKATAVSNSFAETLAQAESGDPMACVCTSVAYMSGHGVKRDTKAGIAWLRRALDQRYPLAMYYYGYAHESGSGVAVDEETAIHWYKKAAYAGDASAQYKLGLAHMTGMSVPRSVSEAIYWYGKAAMANLSEAQFALGELFLNRYGGPDEPEKAMALLLRAREIGSVGATLLLERLDAHGRIVN